MSTGPRGPENALELFLASRTQGSVSTMSSLMRHPIRETLIFKLRAIRDTHMSVLLLKLDKPFKHFVPLSLILTCSWIVNVYLPNEIEIVQ